MINIIAKRLERKGLVASDQIVSDKYGSSITAQIGTFHHFVYLTKDGHLGWGNFWVDLADPQCFDKIYDALVGEYEKTEELRKAIDGPVSSRKADNHPVLGSTPRIATMAR